MSYQDASDLVKFQLQKCTMAAAITVLKCKPPNTTTIDYCKMIRQKILNGNKSPNIDVELPEFDEIEETTDSFGEDAFSNIFDGNVNNDHFSQEATPLFKEFVAANSGSITKREYGFLNFDLLKAIKNVKEIIFQLNGTFSSNEDIYLTSELDKIKNSESTQESGYHSEVFTQQTSLFYKIGKNIDYPSLNNAVLLLLDILKTPPKKDEHNTMVIYISKLIGRLIDVLHQNNINISAFDSVIEMIEKIITELFLYGESHNCKIQSQELFIKLNESYLAVRYSIKEIMKQIERLTVQVSVRNSDKEIELSDPNFIDRSYLLFFLTEYLLKKYSVLKEQFKKRKDVHETDSTMDDYSPVFTNTRKIMFKECSKQNTYENDNIEAIFTEVLNRVALECVETYPLVSFWAIDCLNSATK